MPAMGLAILLRISLTSSILLHHYQCLIAPAQAVVASAPLPLWLYVHQHIDTFDSFYHDSQSISGFWGVDLWHTTAHLSSFFDHHWMQNAELFTLTYGALVTQVVRDYEDPKEVNNQLEKM